MHPDHVIPELVSRIRSANPVEHCQLDGLGLDVVDVALCFPRYVRSLCFVEGWSVTQRVFVEYHCLDADQDGQDGGFSWLPLCRGVTTMVGS